MQYKTSSIFCSGSLQIPDSLQADPFCSHFTILFTISLLALWCHRRRKCSAHKPHSFKWLQISKFCWFSPELLPSMHHSQTLQFLLSLSRVFGLAISSSGTCHRLESSVIAVVSKAPLFTVRTVKRKLSYYLSKETNICINNIAIYISNPILPLNRQTDILFLSFFSI